MTAAQNATNAGAFATCRRGGMTNEEIREIEAHRSRSRPTPWQALAVRYGRCVTDLRLAADPTFQRPQSVVSAPPPLPRSSAKKLSVRVGGQKPRALSEADHRVLAMVEAGSLSRIKAAEIMATTPKTIRRCLERRADAGLQHVSIPLANVINEIAAKMEGS